MIGLCAVISLRARGDSNIFLFLYSFKSFQRIDFTTIYSPFDHRLTLLFSHALNKDALRAVIQIAYSQSISYTRNTFYITYVGFKCQGIFEKNILQPTPEYSVNCSKNISY